MIKKFKVTKTWSPLNRRYIVKVKLETESNDLAGRYYNIMIESLSKVMDRPKNL